MIQFKGSLSPSQLLWMEILCKLVTAPHTLFPRQPDQLHLYLMRQAQSHTPYCAHYTRSYFTDQIPQAKVVAKSKQPYPPFHHRTPNGPS